MRKAPEKAYTLLDIGCGGCDIPLWLLNNARTQGLELKVTCLDHDPRIVEYAQREYGNIPNLNIVCQKMSEIDQNHGFFDYVFANNFLHHVSDDELFPTMKQISRYRRSDLFNQ